MDGQFTAQDKLEGLRIKDQVGRWGTDVNDVHAPGDNIESLLTRRCRTSNFEDKFRTANLS